MGRLHARIPGALLLALAIALAGCGWREATDFVKGRAKLERDEEAHSQEGSKVQLLEVELAPGPEGGEPFSVLRLTLRNARAERLFARLATQSPRSGQSCEDSYMLDPWESARAHCPQRLATDGAFTLVLTVYDDIGHTHVVEQASVSATFDPDGKATLRWK
ncbi:MAG: hypothetical protein ACQGVK_16815 [Myxococcota bacterium]